MAIKAAESLSFGDTYVFTTPYGTCSTGASTAEKTVSVTNFSLETGARITVKFTYKNTADSPTLNVNETGAKAIYWHGVAPISEQYWQAKSALDFVYNGSQWELISAVNNGVDGMWKGDGDNALIYNDSSNVASGNYSHAEGLNTTASGNYSHAEGVGSTASNQSSHAEGNDTTASGSSSHAEGYNTKASGTYSHAEGFSTTASGNYSHAEGEYTTAYGRTSHAEGYYTEALMGQHAQGHYNNTTTAVASAGLTGTSNATAFVIGNGTSGSASNAFRVDYFGKPYAKSALTTTGCDYAEYFEWLDNNLNAEDRRGYFVTLDGTRIKIAKPDDYILGIVSGHPSVIGNGDEDWMGRYMFDEFGAFIYEEFEYEEEMFDEETQEMKTVTKVGTKYKENPDYDPSKGYIQREDRPEWDAVGMLGVLSVRDDGTCKVNGYCKVADGGTATASDTGYRVIARVNENIVKVIFR